MEGLVETEPGVDIPGEIIGGGDDGFQRGAYEGIPVSLRTRKGAGIAAKKRQVRCEFLSKRH